MKCINFLFIFLFTGITLYGEIKDFSIIKYNNPDLIVDLEVGLWPIPIPVDYDSDGLLDILVSCTSAPNKGLYFYKNIGTKNDPLFDKPVKIGEGMNTIYPSYKENKLHVLKPGGEYKDFINNLFSEIVDINVDVNPAMDIKKSRSNKWSYVDYDNDGDWDILVGIDEWSDYGWDNAFDAEGNWKNGPLHGYVYLLENQNGKYVNKGRLNAGAKPIDAYGYPCPMMFDFDGDGDQDIICGEFVDKLTWYENIGTREKPVFTEGRYLENDKGLIKITLEMFVPVAIDFDGDGHVDILAGEEDGRIAFIKNTGKVKDCMPVFESPVYLKQKADNLKFGALVTPYSIDWDGDGDEDLIVGNSAGDLAFIENLTGGENPVWAAPIFFKANNEKIRIMAGENGSIQGPCEAKWGYTVPTVADWDCDGRPDIIINSIWGEILWYKNTGDLTCLQGPFKMKVDWGNIPQKPIWNWWNPGSTDLVTQWRTSAFAIDWNKDGLMDLVMLDHEGYLCFYERFKRGNELWLKPGKRIFYQIQPDKTELLRLSDKQAGGSGRRKLCFVDWDGDGDLDIIINSKNIAFLENVKEENGQVYYIDRGDLGEKKLAGHTTCPTVSDWNKDGIKDVLVGAEDGHLYLFTNPNKKK
nr:VCBS repeat-containing protein [Parabacteroides goldsteinii]